MVPPEDVAATAAAMVEKHPPLPPGLTHDLLEANAGGQTETIMTAQAKRCNGASLACLQGRWNDIVMLIEFPPKNWGPYSQTDVWGREAASRVK